MADKCNQTCEGICAPDGPDDMPGSCSNECAKGLPHGGPHDCGGDHSC